MPLILDEHEGHDSIGSHALNIFVNGAIQSAHKGHRVSFTMFYQGPNGGLRHQHQNAAFQAVPGHIADADVERAV
jgi:hypothetical protein